MFEVALVRPAIMVGGRWEYDAPRHECFKRLLDGGTSYGDDVHVVVLRSCHRFDIRSIGVHHRADGVAGAGRIYDGWTRGGIQELLARPSEG
jgi:acetaldehyde dehydrogenase (acetylating)